MLKDVKDVLWGSPTQKPQDLQAEKQRLADRANYIVQQFMIDIVQIQHTLKTSQEKCYFLKTVDIKSHLSSLEEKYEKEGPLKQYLILGSLISAVLTLENSLEKLVIVWKMLSDYGEFLEKIKNTREKFLLGDIGRIALNPPTIKLKISIIDHPPMTSRLSENINTLLDPSGLLHKLSKKTLKVNENRCSFQEKKIFQEYITNFYKTYSMPVKLSYSVIVGSACEMLVLLYSMFTDEIFCNKEMFEVVEQVNYLVYSTFIKPVFIDLQQVGISSAGKEFEILESSLQANLGKTTHGSGPPSLNSYLTGGK